ncbi:hypothetical protein CRG98_043723 [Punica granatum]|uniref:Uncharacterized protein n=1 Tax=Punica granatum TaxID=22663 RepID=A0A2I0HXB3_PUNGR|nr:hypothetical protein CRG98_043723 [Punica granatum]
MQMNLRLEITRCGPPQPVTGANRSLGPSRVVKNPKRAKRSVILSGSDLRRTSTSRPEFSEIRWTGPSGRAGPTLAGPTELLLDRAGLPLDTGCTAGRGLDRRTRAAGRFVSRAEGWAV